MKNIVSIFFLSFLTVGIAMVGLYFGLEHIKANKKPKVSLEMSLVNTCVEHQIKANFWFMNGRLKGEDFESFTTDTTSDFIISRYVIEDVVVTTVNGKN